MRLAVVGAGIVGITTALELVRDGHEVTVYERRASAGEEASFSHAGILQHTSITPWAAPGLPRQMLARWLQRHSSARLGWPMGLHEMAWLWRWYRSCHSGDYAHKAAALLRLALYSRARLHALRGELELAYERSDGYLVLLRSERERAAAVRAMQTLRDAGLAFRVLEPAQARLLEPALSTDTRFAAAIELPGDEVGNCRQFALLLRNDAQRFGVRFQFHANVQRIESASGIRVTLEGSTQPVPFDGLVVCAGNGAAQLLHPLRLRIPLAPVRGHTLGAAIREPLNAPRSAVWDAHYQVAVSRLGQRIRVSGGAQLGGTDAPARGTAGMQTLYKVLHDWFPGAAQHTAGVQEWTGARPMLPDGLPVVGAGGPAGLWLNLGHGASGWTLACGSARALADQIQGREPEIDMRAFALARLLRAGP